MSADCLFCKIVAGSIPARRVYEDELCLSFADIHPQAPVHLLVIPKEHIASQAHCEEGHLHLLGGRHMGWPPG
jgi:histidine triad (HIT) family protein